jgi:hypothetical protein
MASYIPEDGILHSHRRENLKSYTLVFCSFLAKYYRTNLTGNYTKKLLFIFNTDGLDENAHLIHKLTAFKYNGFISTKLLHGFPISPMRSSFCASIALAILHQ